MLGGLRFVFFSIMFSILAAGIVFLLVSDDVAEFLSRTPDSATPTPSDDVIDTGIHVTKAPEPAKIPIAKEPEDLPTSEVETTDNAEPQKIYVKPDPDYLSKEQWEKYRKIRDNAGNLYATIDKYINDLRNYKGFNPDNHLVNALDEKTIKELLDFSLDEINTDDERKAVKDILNYSFNRNIVDKMLELLKSSDSKQQQIAYDYFYYNVFPELGDVIVEQLVENPNYQLWFSGKSDFCRVKSIFQIFSYYADLKTYPLFLKAYSDYVDYRKDEEGNRAFNSFFAGISSHVPFDKTLEELTPDYWLTFYETYQAFIVGLKRTEESQIVAMEQTGNILIYHEEFVRMFKNASTFRRFPEKTTRYTVSGSVSTYYPTHLTFVPHVLDFINSTLSDTYKIDSVNAKKTISTLDFLSDVNHPIYAKEMYLYGNKFIDVDKIRKFVSLYFSRVANYEGYGLKFATEYLKKNYKIDDNCRNMLIAIDEPELIEYLLKYERTNENWASVMVRLTRKTFGSLSKDRDIETWKKYFSEIFTE